MITIHSTITKHCNLLMDIQIARKAGFDAVEITMDKLYRFFNAGYTKKDVIDALDGLNVAGVGFLTDIERQNKDFDDLLAEANKIFKAAHSIGSPGVEIITGPLDVMAVKDFISGKRQTRYTGLLGMEWKDQRRITAANVAKLADLAKEYEITLYLEALAWTPVKSIANSLEVIDEAGRDNVKLVIDYWHGYVAGDTPEQIAKINKKHIFGVHMCNSLPYEGGVPDESVLRNVEMGKGVVPLKEWTEAVKSTGFDGFWGCESFCKAQQEKNPYDVAAETKKLVQDLINP